MTGERASGFHANRVMTAISSYPYSGDTSIGDIDVWPNRKPLTALPGACRTTHLLPGYLCSAPEQMPCCCLQP